MNKETESLKKSEENTIIQTHKYQNPDKRCGHIAIGNDYCWSFANHVDGTSGFEDMKSICDKCESWNEDKYPLVRI